MRPSSAKSFEELPLLGTGKGGKASYGGLVAAAPGLAKPRRGKAVLDDDDDDPATRKSGISGLFRYASRRDKLLMFVGLLFATVHGASFPVLALVFGQMTNTFILQSTVTSVQKKQNESVVDGEMFGVSPTTPLSTITDPDTTSVPDMNEMWRSGALSPSEFTAYMSQFSLYYLYIGIGVLAAAFIQTVCWELACEGQVHSLRKIFYAQILRQDISWYDQNQENDLTSKLSDDLERVREGIGSKFSMVIQYVATFVSGLAVGLYANWRLTVVILGVGPLLIGTSGFLARVAASTAAREQLKYSIAGGIADEVLNCIRTVAAFGAQAREVNRYEKALEKGRWMAMKKYYVLSVGLGVVFFVTYASYGLAFWYGAELIGAGVVTPGSVFTVFFSVMAGAFSLGNALPFVNAVSTAVGAASNIFNVIDRVPSIDPYDTRGLKPEKVKGHIEFRMVGFSYPARPEIKVLQDFTVSIESGKTVALVGQSGAGKSTVVGLLLRFYDATIGRILLDGVDIKELNLSWLRSQIGVVSQEPVLFATSIYENIRYGRDNVSRAEVVQAALIANAHSFITTLPDGYETMVGDRGAQLSGGQKQRIAIARALVRNPKILLLDEATSALDAHSEGVVQAALDSAMQGRTTIIIAHRLSTVKNADLIYAMKNGAIEEFGTHKELMSREGLYHNLVMAQMSDKNAAPHDYSSGGEALGTGGESYEAIQSSVEKKFRKRRSLSLSLASLDDPELDRLAKEAEVADVSANVSVSRLFRLNAPEWVWLLLGFIGCALTGSIMPIFAFFYGEVFATFTLRGEELREAALFWTYMFLVLAVASGFSFWLQLVAMTTAAEKLVMRMRLFAFKNICDQAVGWFDLESSSAGRLINRLARDAPLVKAAAGLRAGQVIGAIVTLLAALVIAFIFGWKLALLLVVAVPFIAGASYQQMMILRRNQRRDAELMNDAARVASESVTNIRTVQSLGKERLFFELYLGYLSAPFVEAKKQAIIYSIVFALSQAVIYMMYAGAFRFGAYLIEVGDMAPTDVYRVFFALAFCAASVGQTSAYLQDYAKAKLAASLMFQLIDRKPDIDCSSATGIRPVIAGKVTFKDVKFHYPARPDVPVLRGLSFSVEPGQTLALVGSSGCGKSTAVALLERFYDPHFGSVMVDDIDIRTINLPHLRAHIGLVTQEPVLFDCSIRHNIAYGKAFSSRDSLSYLATGDEVLDTVPMSEIIEAAKAANIHNFVSSLPQGYETMAGDRGTQLSGGQKQRIAIARALLRNPKILLLDEATSALDTESEKIVQEALDHARKGRTCITIAHRLSTVQNADCIAVIHNGRIAEMGTHEELKARRGRYYQLIKRQRL
ncbi:ATP-dependent translocase ABCB1-like isoform X2 [Frankliniella occidentalis]|uniref:ABC-type xenobiotic transporter n=1 Tax=Frankliniella occidentalis TaxID=133901 RepID=A0A6J1RZN8_FRAOC|nr:ATP-dependent translocase ABCB1-like isoform X2 [Frankliniella occidentalis]